MTETVRPDADAAPNVTPLAALADDVGRGVAVTGVRAVLGVFVNESHRPLDHREVARRAGVGVLSARLALDRLESLGLIAADGAGERGSYRAVGGTLEFFQAMLPRGFGMTAAVANALRRFGDRVEWAAVFGPAAAGEGGPRHDVDLLVVGGVSRDELIAPVARIGRELRRRVRVVLLDPHELRESGARGDLIVTAILSGPRVDVIGAPEARTG